MHLRLYALAAALALAPALAEKKVITSADQLPRREYAIPKLPSELLTGPKADLDAVAAAVDRDLAADLATLDIRDRATRTGMLQSRAGFAVHRGDLKAAQGFLREIRAQQEKEADKLLSGRTMESLIEARLQGGSPEAQRDKAVAELARQWGAMPWDVVGTNLKGAKSSLELMSREVAIGAIKTQLDPAAKNLGLKVPAGMVSTIVAMRNNFELVLPARDALVATLQGLVDRNQVARADVWSERLVTLPATAPARPVVVGIWDSGTDVKLFKPASAPGIAFDKDLNETGALVRPMGAAESRLPMLKQYITAGAVDQSGVETAFSTFGKTVVVHANGFEVTSYLPGGEKMKLSGTSMASPQVANLAAKLFALKPGLTPAQVKELILKGAERNGRMNLINPKKTLGLV